MAALDEDRIKRIYEKLTGQPYRHGSWIPERRSFVEKIIRIDEACHSVIETVAALEKAGPGTDIKSLEAVLRTEFKFLDGLKK
jgi:hypothetical protein